MTDSINYFGSNPKLPNDAAAGDRPFDSAGDTQLTLGAEVERAASAPSVTLHDSYTRQSVPRGAWAEIDLSAIAFNVQQARRACGPQRLLCAVVKADAYGHGAVRVARAAIEAGADRLAVATPEEGVELRQAGFTEPILLLAQPPQRTIPLLLAYSITPAVYTQEFALDYAEQADLQGREAPFHLAVNTGMNRIGVFYLDAGDFIKGISFHRALKYEGTFTHFATADCAEQLDFYEQHRRFEEALRLIREAGFNPGIVHAANSASIFRYPQVHYDMVRLGICLYGLDYNPEVSGGSVVLKPAMSIKAEISAVKEPQVGEGVSYGMNYRVGKPVQIATLPLGYADGVRRELTKKGFKVLWNGRPVSQVGNICMDQMMIEIPLGYSVTGIKGGGAQPGDEVVIIGTQGDYELTADTMAEALGTITHEITCLFGLRLPRVYV